MKKFVFTLGISILFAFSSNAFSQSICPIVTVKVNKVSGKILVGGRLEEPLPNIKVELRKFDDEETLVSTAVTDKSGLFEFDNIRKGEYIFNTYFVFNNELYLKYRAIVKVKKSNSLNSKPSILIRFGIDCHETEIKTVKKVKENL
ncbi:MAG: hypothetical protein M3405_04090 [Acidobacteriota bacterium]|jgi:5-hydroxyisourate hydrolase-like protein (transthyretin family)|nr:hypothetical protein [Acidobacteriota bacterium]